MQCDDGACTYVSPREAQANHTLREVQNTATNLSPKVDLTLAQPVPGNAQRRSRLNTAPMCNAVPGLSKNLHCMYLRTLDVESELITLILTENNLILDRAVV